MPDTDSVLISKEFAYRGQPEIYTNRYHLEGSTPTTRAAWVALIQAIWGAERAALGTAVTFVGASGYEAGNDAAKFMATVGEVAGIKTAAGGTGAVGAQSAGYPPGDAAIWVRWATDQRTSKNKPVYLRKYFHGCPQGDTTGDIPLAAVRTGLSALGTKMTDGSLPGGMKICGPQGTDALTASVAQYFTTRTLKRNARTPV